MRTGRVDLADLVVEYNEENTGKSDLTKTECDKVPRYLPEEVPDYFFTRNELKSIGFVSIHDAAAYVSYPELRREYPLFHVEETKLTKRQSGFSLIRKDYTIDEVLDKRRHKCNFKISLANPCKEVEEMDQRSELAAWIMDNRCVHLSVKAAAIGHGFFDAQQGCCSM